MDNRRHPIGLFVGETGNLHPLFRGEKTLDRLLLDAGLSLILKGHGRRPAVSYEGEIEGVAVEIEFLTHQKGPKDVEIITVQENLHAQALRFISVSRLSPSGVSSKVSSKPSIWP